MYDIPIIAILLLASAWVLSRMLFGSGGAIRIR
jgi:hypothetical protein